MGVQQKLMRHTQISTTMNVYGNALKEEKREANAAVLSRICQSKRPCGPSWSWTSILDSRSLRQERAQCLMISQRRKD
jgi:hypothetical protein